MDLDLGRTLRREARLVGTVLRKPTWKLVAPVVLGFACSFDSCDRQSWLANYNELRGDSYVLDDYDRSVTTDAPVICPEVELETYAGDTVRFAPAVQVFPAFAERLRRFENVLVAVAQRYYGRAPRRILNAGGYLCRAVRHRPTHLSEHALGNAIDVVGFDFALLPASPDAEAKGVPEPLRAALSVRVERDWRATDGVSVRHRQFLEALTSALEEQDVFRTMLGPGHPTHGTHFHFDMAPYSYVRL